MNAPLTYRNSTPRAQKRRVADHLRQREPLTAWSDEDLADLERYVNLKYTGSQISDMMPERSRSAILGKVHKLGWTMKSGRSSVKVNVPRPIKKKPVEELRLKPDENHRPRVPGVKQDPLKIKPKVKMSANPQRLTELPKHGCKWPQARGVDGEWLLCSDPRYGDYPYCKEHCTMSYQPKQPRKK